MYDIIIIGAGPAGLTAAIYACRASKNVLVLEAGAYGGQIINSPAVENYPAEANISGFDLAVRLYEQAKGLGAKVVFEKAVDIIVNGSSKVIITTKNSYEASAVILATGSNNRKLGLEGEDELVGKGVSYCATCDGAFYKSKTVAVVGGGNTALEDALYLSDIASKVILIHRRDSFRGDEATVNALKNKDNIEFVYNSTVTRLIADNRLNAVEITNKDGSVSTIETDGLFVAIGRVPENQNYAKLVELDESGYVVAGEDCLTATPGIFVAGDNRQKDVRQLVTAMSDGAVAATNAVRYVNGI